MASANPRQLGEISFALIGLRAASPRTNERGEIELFGCWFKLKG